MHSFRITDSKTTNMAYNENKPTKAIIEDDQKEIDAQERVR